MKLIQLNAWGGRLGSSLLRFLKDQKADILLLQEVYNTPEGNTGWFDLLKNVQDHTKLEHAFFSPVADLLYGKKRIYFGLATLSNTAFTKTHEEFTHLKYIKDFNEDDHDYNIRLFQHAVISEGGKDVQLINYHGFHDPSGKMGNDVTMKHCQQIADYIARLDGPTILTGDFNLAPNSPSLERLNTMLINLCVKNDIQTTRNQFARSMTTVDYIWVSPDITVNRFEILPDLVSDHAALVLEFDV